ncbi:hypothetical protein ABW20_dc0104075 [Dactylellina cionopaga]|nr:hypothetical protein ABW20_dc0104075 [Dactylellina cionopaga]
MKESQRINNIASIVSTRLTLRDFTFKSGRVPLTLPKGTFVTYPATAMHLSENLYGPDAREWKGFRFSDIREKEINPELSARHQAAATSNTYVAFSLGRHACPGRFFAMYQVKLFVVYVLLKYDIKWPLSRDGKRLDNKYVFGMRSADTDGELEFREREEWKGLKGRWGDVDDLEDD